MNHLKFVLQKIFFNIKSYNFSFLNIIQVILIISTISLLVISKSIINGFENEFSNKFLNIIPQAKLYSLNDNYINNVSVIKKHINKEKNIISSSEYTNISSLFRAKNNNLLLLIVGINPNDYIYVSDISKYIESSSKLNKLLDGNNIIIGKTAAIDLKLKIGDNIQAFIIKKINDNEIIDTNVFRISGILNSGTELDRRVAILNINTANRLLGLKNNSSTGIQIKFKNPVNNTSLNHEILDNYGLRLSTWKDDFSYIYNDINLIKSIWSIIFISMSILLSFILIGNVIIFFNRNKYNIFILSHIGFSFVEIQYIFLLYGFIKYIIMLLIGIFIGSLISKFILTDIILLIQDIFNFSILDKNQYFIDFVPSYLDFYDISYMAILFIIIVSVLYSLLILYFSKKPIAIILNKEK